MATCKKWLKVGPLVFGLKRSPNSIHECCLNPWSAGKAVKRDLLLKRSLSYVVASPWLGVGRTLKWVQTTHGLDTWNLRWIRGAGNSLNFRRSSSESNSNSSWYLRPPPTTCLQHPDPIDNGTLQPQRSTDKESKLRQTSLKFKETKEKVKSKMEKIIYKENIFTIPNLLCVTRIALSPVLGYLVLQHSYHYALGIFVFAGATDLLDGLIARHFPSQQSMLGTFLDPMADKMLISLLFLSLTVTELIPVQLTALIIVRDLCLMYAGFYIRYVSLPPPKTLSRYFDVTFVTAKLSPTLISKVNTSVQLSLVACTLAAPVFDLVNHPYLQMLWYVTAATTISSGVSYMCHNDTFEVLQQSKSEKTTSTKSDS